MQIHVHFSFLVLVAGLRVSGSIAGVVCSVSYVKPEQIIETENSEPLHIKNLSSSQFLHASLLC